MPSSAAIRRHTVCLAVLAALGVPTLGAPGRSAPVSPGRVDRPTAIEGRCPTFSLVPSDRPVEIAVYGLDGEETLEPEREPSIVHTLPAGAASWSPPADRCLTPGRLYAWALRERSEAPSEWSAPLLFRVLPSTPGAPPATIGGAADGSASGGDLPMHDSDPASAGRTPGSARADRDRVAIPATAPVKLSVDGAVQAAAFAGDGSALTGIDWSALANVPAGFADGTDDVIVYAAGNQLQLQGTTFDVVEGAGSDLDADLLDGLEGAAYAQQALTYTKDEVDSLLVIDNIGAPIPAAPELLRIENEPRFPGMRRLAWNMPSIAGVASFVVYQAGFPITEANKATSNRRFSGTFHAAVDLFAGSGSQHFRVEALNVLGDPGPLSTELVIDTAPRLFYVADQRADDLFELFVAGQSGGAQRVSEDLISFGDVATTKWSPDGTRIAYQADQETDDLYELFVVPAGGGASTKVSGPLVTAGDVSYIFEWSPDGTRLAYLADQDADEVFELYVVQASGGPATKVSGPLVDGGDVSFFLWSPDGTRLAYRADQDTNGHPELYVVPATGGGSTKVSDPLQGNVGVSLFGWSPDGTRLAFVDDPEASLLFELFVVPATGGQPVKLNKTLVAGGEVLDFRWSPDGSRIAYLADQEVDLVGELWVVPASGGEVTKLNDPLVASGDVGSYFWSPDGTRVAYAADQDVNNVVELYVVPASGGGANKVSGGGGLQNFAWSPDARRLAYRADQDAAGVFELYVTPADGGAPIRVSDPLVGGGDVAKFAWSPDGSRLAYLADQQTDGVFELYVAPATGGGAVEINDPLIAGGDVTGFAWRPLGNP